LRFDGGDGVGVGYGRGEGWRSTKTLENKVWSSSLKGKNLGGWVLGYGHGCYDTTLFTSGVRIGVKDLYTWGIGFGLEVQDISIMSRYGRVGYIIALGYFLVFLITKFFFCHLIPISLCIGS
jgi:hypothetical protein